MKHSTGKPTKAEQLRMDKLVNTVGCIVTRVYKGAFAQAEIHHLVEGDRRLGHRFTVPLSAWFHRGVPPIIGMTQETAEYIYGPSKSLSPAAFRERFGTDRDLLEMTDAILAKLEQVAA